MDITIQSLGFKASNDLEAFIHEKLDKLINKDQIIRANVVLFHGADNNPESDYCEIRLEMPGNDPFAKRSSPSFEQAVVDTVEVLQKQLRKAKEKQVDRRQGQA
jgi:putative sigma-54 modulation protein